MACRVHVASPLRSYTAGASRVEASGASVADILADLDRRYRGIRFRIIDEQNRIRPHIRIFVNDSETTRLGEAVRESDEVHLICALSGG